MAKKKQANLAHDPRGDMVIGLLLLVASYAFISWAIDSGVLWWYIFTFVALYYSISYLKKYVGQQFFNNGKNKKAK